MLFKRNKLNVPPPRPPDLPFDEAARDALGGATAQAQKANASAVHAEHLLLALLEDPRAVPSRALTPNRLRTGRHQTPHRARRPAASVGGARPRAPLCGRHQGRHRVRHARGPHRRRCTRWERVSLLLGVLQSPHGVPFRALAHLDITPVALRSAIAAEGPHPPSATG